MQQHLDVVNTQWHILGNGLQQIKNKIENIEIITSRSKANMTPNKCKSGCSNANYWKAVWYPANNSQFNVILLQNNNKQQIFHLQLIGYKENKWHLSIGIIRQKINVTYKILNKTCSARHSKNSLPFSGNNERKRFLEKYHANGPHYKNHVSTTPSVALVDYNLHNDQLC